MFTGSSGRETCCSNSAGDGRAFKRYRLTLSDSKNTFNSCILASQCNDLIDHNDLKDYSVIQLNNFTYHSQGPKPFLTVLDLTVLSNMSQQIGDPTPLQPITNTNVEDTNDVSQATNDASSSSTTNGNMNNTSLTNTASNSAQFSMRLTTSDSFSQSERIEAINMLTKYLPKWTIRARVSNKTPVRSYSNGRGEGKYFSCDLIDETGEIRAVAFGDECTRFYDMLETGDIYYITKGMLKPANRRFNTLSHDFEMTLVAQTSIRPCMDVTNIPDAQFNFIPISDIENKLPNSFIDVIGVVTRTSDIQIITSRQSNKELIKRELELCDENGKISVTLWGEEETPQTVNHGYRFSATWKTLNQIVDEKLGLDDKPDYIMVKCVCSFIKTDSIVYMSCPEDDCKKKVFDNRNGTYHCTKCSHDYNDFKWAYMVLAELSDSTSSQWTVFFQNEAEALLGISASKFGEAKMNNNDNFVEDYLSKITFKEKIFRLRIKAENFNDERRVRVSCIGVYDIDHVDYTKKMLDFILY
ncbi:unnamed protein product [Didymodactylos carnosus]|uniref:Replication protein A 70 kDa DNA-binding subunit n=1 Tax=Didymodactylos carnosus TaxID=1234261 RepID=A0A813TFH5_9BILA|nr:unnamed protein product [Didymodactylos carnosus]CAF3597581.1 unnamed protein product [Didymodactylos carnosus]